MNVMRYGVLGTGMVGKTIATKLAELGHEVTIGARKLGNTEADAWAQAAPETRRSGSFADAASFGETVVNATSGVASIDALRSAGAENLSGKVLIDATSPTHSSEPANETSLSVCNTDSLGEQIQRTFPEARVVKSLNTVNHQVMVDPSLVPGSHSIFLCGDDQKAKQHVAGLLESFGWPPPDIIDLGDISQARGTEMYVALWVRLWQVVGPSHFNINVVKA